jgi:hypothetical protein
MYIYIYIYIYKRSLKWESSLITKQKGERSDMYIYTHNVYTETFTRMYLFMYRSLKWESNAITKQEGESSSDMYVYIYINIHEHIDT